MLAVLAALAAIAAIVAPLLPLIIVGLLVWAVFRSFGTRPAAPIVRCRARSALYSDSHPRRLACQSVSLS